MVSIVDHAGHQLCNAEREDNKPKTKADWENLAEHATQLAVLRNKSFRPLATVNSMMSRRCVTKVNDHIPRWVLDSRIAQHAERP